MDPAPRPIAARPLMKSRHKDPAPPAPPPVVYTRDEGDRPASVREIVALRAELRALRDRVESLTGLVAKRLGIEDNE
jgi:hypothetical protein